MPVAIVGLRQQNKSVNKRVACELPWTPKHPIGQNLRVRSQSGTTASDDFTKWNKTYFVAEPVHFDQTEKTSFGKFETLGMTLMNSPKKSLCSTRMKTNTQEWDASWEMGNGLLWYRSFKGDLVWKSLERMPIQHSSRTPAKHPERFKLSGTSSGRKYQLAKRLSLSPPKSGKLLISFVFWKPIIKSWKPQGSHRPSPTRRSGK